MDISFVLGQLICKHNPQNISPFEIFNGVPIKAATNDARFK